MNDQFHGSAPSGCQTRLAPGSRWERGSEEQLARQRRGPTKSRCCLRSKPVPGTQFQGLRHRLSPKAAPLPITSGSPRLSEKPLMRPVHVSAVIAPPHGCMSPGEGRRAAGPSPSVRFICLCVCISTCSLRPTPGWVLLSFNPWSICPCGNVL